MENKIENLEGEEWRIIKWAPDYMISSMGRVKTMKSNPHKIMVGSRIAKLKYPAVVLRHDGISTTRTIHRLMSEAFLGHNPNGKIEIVVNHIDGNVENNVLSNLEIITQRQNCAHGRVCQGTANESVNIEVNCGGRYVCRVYVNKRRINLGSFDLKIDAELRRDEFLKHLDIGDVECWIANLIVNPDKSSQENGICYASSIGKWQVKFFHKKKYYYLGLFDTEAEAITVINEARLRSSNCDFDFWYNVDYLYRDRFSGLTGVSFSRKYNKYVAKATAFGISKGLGYYVLESDARNAVISFWNSKRQEIIDRYMLKRDNVTS